MPSLRLPQRSAALLAATLATASWVGPALLGPESTRADVSGAIASNEATAAGLQARVAADTRQIEHTAGGLAAAQARLATLQAQADQRGRQLAQVQSQLLAARDRLVRLENRLHTATGLLAANLVASYEGSTPDALGVLLSSHGFSDLIERVDFLHSIALENAHVVKTTRDARQQVTRQAAALGTLEDRDRALAAAVASQRNQAASLEAALAAVQASQLERRSRDAGSLASVRGRLHELRARQAAALAAAQHAAASPAPAAPGSPAAGIPLDSGGMVQAPPGAPQAVAQVIAAGNAIAGLPYSYGGGHASFHANAYDCSGSVSYALAAAGLVSSPLDSTGFESWGQPGPGRWITVYANAGHAFMMVAGWRFDTVALSEGGTRWSRSPADTSAFVARHPPGL